MGIRVCLRFDLIVCDRAFDFCSFQVQRLFIKVCLSPGAVSSVSFFAICTQERLCTGCGSVFACVVFLRRGGRL